MVSEKERVATLEANMKNVLKCQEDMAIDIKDIKRFMVKIEAALPTLATKDSLNHAINDRKRDMKEMCEETDLKLSSVKRSSKVQAWFIGILGTTFGAMMMYLINFWLENK